MGRILTDEFDGDLLAEIRPTDWQNPAPPPRYDLVVLGNGKLASLAARYAAARGARVALATDQPLALDVLGEELPRQTLREASRRVVQSRAATRLWPEAQLGALDFAALRRDLRARQLRAAAQHGPRALTEQGIDVHLGPMTFAGPDVLKVAGSALRFSRAVIALAPRTSACEIAGLAEGDYYTPDSLCRLATLPRRLAILSGEPAACELAQTLQRLGCDVCLITSEPALLQSGDRVPGKLPIVDPAASEVIQRRLAADKVRLFLGWRCLQVERTGTARGVLIERGSQRQKLLVDEVLFIGPRHNEIDWLRIGVAQLRAQAGDAGTVGDVAADGRLKTDNRRIYAIGAAQTPDPCDQGAYENLARLAVDNIVGWRQRLLSVAITSRRLETDPPICWLGPDPSLVFGIAEIESRSVPLDGKLLGNSPSESPRMPDSPGIHSADLDGADQLILHLHASGRRVLGATMIGVAACGLAAQLTKFLRTDRGGKAARLLKQSQPDAWLRELFAER